MISRQPDQAGVQSKILGWLQEKMPQARTLSISNMERPGTGLSNDIFIFDLSWEEGGQQRSEGRVVRCAPISYPIYAEFDLRNQFHVLDRLQGTDVPSPRVYWYEEDENLLGAPFFLMDKLEGVIPPDFPPYHSFGPYYDATPDRRARMWWSSLETMAKVHKVDWKRREISILGDPGRGASPLDQQLDYQERYLNWVEEDPQRQPILRVALDWLRENRYTLPRVTLCWGDCRMGNMIYGPDGKVVGALDWDITFLGDPEGDLALFLFSDWMTSEAYGVPRLEGSPGREETVQRYQELTGWTVQNLFYQEVLAVLRVGIVTLKVQKNLKALGVPLGSEDTETNNACTQRLASLLGLPAPGAPQRQTTRLEEVTVTVQFHLTGPGGGDWYVVSERGEATRHEGIVPDPDCTLTVSAEDWAAIQRGEISRMNAWTLGKLKIGGDMTLLLQLEDVISKLG